jgi:glucan-binding YG repeat protein
MATEYHARAAALEAREKVRDREIAELKAKLAATEKELADLRAFSGAKAPAVSGRPTPEEIKAAIVEFKKLQAEAQKQGSYTYFSKESIRKNIDPNNLGSPTVTAPESEQIHKMKPARVRWVEVTKVNKKIGPKSFTSTVGGYPVIINGVSTTDQNEGDVIAIQKPMLCVGKDTSTVEGQEYWVLEPVEVDATPARPARR